MFMPHTFIKPLSYARHRGRCWGRVVGKIDSALVELSRKANVFQMVSGMNMLSKTVMPESGKSLLR